MKPQVLFVGPTKSGTTWIDRYLRNHPDVALPRLTKETFFFDKQYHKGMRWYEAHFEPDTRAKACIEIAPSLFAKSEAIRRVAKDLPDVKVVCTMRDPVDRAVSHYFHYLKAGSPDIGFAAMTERHPNIVEAGLYQKYLSEWDEAIGKERLILLSYDLMRTAPEEFCAELCEVIGVDYLPPPADLLNKGVNGASVPKHPWLAQTVWRSAEMLRAQGVHRLVNAIRESRLKRLAFGAPPEASHRQRVRQQAVDYYGRLHTGDLPKESAQAAPEPLLR
jgi:hypothetical protein